MKSTLRMLAIAMMTMPLMAAAQQTDSHEVIAKVPFAFMAGNRTMPAGECVVQSADRTGTTIAIRNWNSNTSLYSLVSSGEAQKGAAVNALIFHKYGSRYFLTAMELASTGLTYRLPEGRAEAELRAQNAPAAEEILVAALK
jgi:hypothetical protein